MCSVGLILMPNLGNTKKKKKICEAANNLTLHQRSTLQLNNKQICVFALSNQNPDRNLIEYLKIKSVKKELMNFSSHSIQ